MEAVEFVTVPEFTILPFTVVTTEVPLVLYVLPLLIVNVPLISAEVLEASVMFKVEPMVSEDPDPTTKSSPVPLLIVSVTAALLVNVRGVLLFTTKRPIPIEEPPMDKDIALPSLQSIVEFAFLVAVGRVPPL